MLRCAWIVLGPAVQSLCLRISGSNAGYTMFLGSVKGTGYPLHSPVSTSLPLPCVTVCHHSSTGVHLLRETRTVNTRRNTGYAMSPYSFTVTRNANSLVARSIILQINIWRLINGAKWPLWEDKNCRQSFGRNSWTEERERERYEGVHGGII